MDLTGRRGIGSALRSPALVHRPVANGRMWARAPNSASRQRQDPNYYWESAGGHLPAHPQSRGDGRCPTHPQPREVERRAPRRLRAVGLTPTRRAQHHTRRQPRTPTRAGALEAAPAANGAPKPHRFRDCSWATVRSERSNSEAAALLTGSRSRAMATVAANDKKMRSSYRRS